MKSGRRKNFLQLSLLCALSQSVQWLQCICDQCFLICFAGSACCPFFLSLKLFQSRKIFCPVLDRHDLCHRVGYCHMSCLTYWLALHGTASTLRASLPNKSLYIALVFFPVTNQAIPQSFVYSFCLATKAYLYSLEHYCHALSYGFWYYCLVYHCQVNHPTR